LSARTPETKASLRHLARRALGATDSTELQAWFVPGRIELLGKHTDYAGGRSLICATQQGFSLVARPRRDRVLHIVDALSGERAELPLEPSLRIPSGEWAAYPATVVRRLARDFGPLECGLELAFASDLPRDAGVSSSSALVVGVALALASVNRLDETTSWRAAFADREALAGYLGALENGKAFGSFGADGGVGTMGGTQDHTAILCARPGMLCQYGFDPVRFERAVPFPAGYVLAVGVSGVTAAKTREALTLYNVRAEAVKRLLEIWWSRTGRNDATLHAAVTSAPDAAARLAGFLAAQPDGEPLQARLEQFTAECEAIIPAVGDLLERGETSGLGSLVDRSQAGAERGLDNQVAETIHLQRSARRLGAAAASAFGAGFGGSVWAIVELNDAGEFLERWKTDYLSKFPQRARSSEFLLTLPGSPAQAEDSKLSS
jgi:galactokinase